MKNTPMQARLWPTLSLLAGLLTSTGASWAQLPAPAVQGSGELPVPLIQAWQKTGLPLSSLSVWVQEVNQPAPRLSVAADEPRRMASVMKLITTGVALRTLGPAHTWTTSVALGGTIDTQGVLHGPVFIRASGDPSLDATRLREALEGWRDAGLREIHGDLIVDKRLWRLPPHDPGAFDGEPLKAYNAGPDPWLIAHGAITLRWRTDGGLPGQPQVWPTPGLHGLVLDNQVQLSQQGPCGDWRAGISQSLSTSPEGIRTWHLQGRYPVACGVQNWTLRWPTQDALEHSARVWAATWVGLGGRMSGAVREGPWPDTATPWVSWTSPALSEVVRDINKFSNNVMARHLFLTLGQAPAPDTPSEVTGMQSPLPDTLSQARSQVTAHVQAATRQADGSRPCEAPGALLLDNGSGLSRTEGASARCMGRWMQVMWEDPFMPEWLASLPVAGLDGTARRMTAATGRAHLKTGSLDDVVSVAGIVQGWSGRRYALVAVVNDPKAEQARGALQALLQWITEDTP
jgi:D-alanyl-D-alanine carboxypeptidase/D-alanyl-D-alanine-endopeptidase (penicillin-binding protein 4)